MPSSSSSSDSENSREQFRDRKRKTTTDSSIRKKKKKEAKRFDIEDIDGASSLQLLDSQMPTDVFTSIDVKHIDVRNEHDKISEQDHSKLLSLLYVDQKEFTEFVATIKPKKVVFFKEASQFNEYKNFVIKVFTSILIKRMNIDANKKYLLAMKMFCQFLNLCMRESLDYCIETLSKIQQVSDKGNAEIVTGYGFFDSDSDMSDNEEEKLEIKSNVNAEISKEEEFWQQHMIPFQNAVREYFCKIRLAHQLQIIPNITHNNVKGKDMIELKAVKINFAQPIVVVVEKAKYSDNKNTHMAVVTSISNEIYMMLNKYIDFGVFRFNENSKISVGKYKEKMSEKHFMLSDGTMVSEFDINNLTICYVNSILLTLSQRAADDNLYARTYVNPLQGPFRGVGDKNVYMIALDNDKENVRDKGSKNRK